MILPGSRVGFALPVLEPVERKALDQQIIVEAPVTAIGNFRTGLCLQIL
jgi:hypothetical protein